MDSYEARKLLIRNGFNVKDFGLSYRIPIVENAKYEDVEQLLRDNGYMGSFGVIKEAKRKKVEAVDTG